MSLRSFPVLVSLGFMVAGILDLVSRNLQSAPDDVTAGRQEKTNVRRPR